MTRPAIEPHAVVSREEWLVVLTVVCACGFLSLLGFRRTSL